jgi:hypothetical protein
LESQALIHHQYNRDGGFNFIPLKTNLTYKGNSVRGNNTNYSDDNYPDVDYRTYTAINSGLNQEKGNDNITLSFTFTDQEYEVNGGQTLTFTIDKRNYGELPTLFPHEQININDTKFVKNGAFASSVPYFSDRVKMLQDGGLPKGTPNNATYLCTWLYKEDDDTTTQTQIKQLTTDERVNEIAIMLSGSTIEDTAIANARSLLNFDK